MKFAASPLVVAIASVSGGGKTTAVEQLAEYLPHAKALYFDQFVFDGPTDMMAEFRQSDRWHSSHTPNSACDC